MLVTELAFFTDQVESMATFYRNLLSAEPVAESDDMAIFMAGHTKIFIHRTYPAEDGELPPENHIALTVPNVDEAAKALAEKGVKIEIEPKDYYWGRSAYLRDPDGQMIELNQPE